MGGGLWGLGQLNISCSCTSPKIFKNGFEERYHENEKQLKMVLLGGVK